MLAYIQAGVPVKLYRKRDFWLVLVLGVLFVITVYADLLRGQSALSVDEFQLTLFTLQQIIYLSLIAIAAWRFGFGVGFFCWGILGAVTIPYSVIFLSDNWHPNLLLEMIIIGLVGLAEVFLINGYEQGKKRLLGHQHTLEDRVQERTLDLTKANLALEKDIIERRKVEGELRDALAQVKTLTGLLPICANCKKIRDDNGYWSSVEKYVSDHSEAEFTHGICPECLEKLYPSYYGPGKKNRGASDSSASK